MSYKNFLVDAAKIDENVSRETFSISYQETGWSCVEVRATRLVGRFYFLFFISRYKHATRVK